MKARKISFQEAWDSSTIFFIDEELEREIEAEIDALLETARCHTPSQVSASQLVDFLTQQRNALHGSSS